MLAPTLLFLLYAALWESDAYVAESRVTVQASQKQKSASPAPRRSSEKSPAAAAAAATPKDLDIVLNYIKSSAIISDLGGRDYLERVFSKKDIDFFSRFPRDEPTEEARKVLAFAG